jgi:two-component system nitrate/nitrite response regulator NarL
MEIGCSLAPYETFVGERGRDKMVHQKLTQANEVVHENGSSNHNKIATLIRQLIEHVDKNGSPRVINSTDGKQQEILLNVFLDDADYTLTRTKSKRIKTQVRLSPREREIVNLVAQGLPNKMIASVLEISPWTVATHLRRIFVKLGVNSRAEMVAQALKDEKLMRYLRFG